MDEELSGYGAVEGVLYFGISEKAAFRDRILEMKLERKKENKGNSGGVKLDWKRIAKRSAGSV